MENVVDLTAWRRSRGWPPRGPGFAEGSSPRGEGGGGSDADIRRLEIAVSRLNRVATTRLERTGRLEPAMETELLAILGAIATDLIEEAAARAERLAGRLAGRPVG